MATPRAVAAVSIRSTVRLPASVRLKTSRPKLSVPNQWCVEGWTNLSSRCTSVGPYGTRIGQRNATTTQRPRTVTPTTPVGRRRTLAYVAVHDLPGWGLAVGGPGVSLSRASSPTSSYVCGAVKGNGSPISGRRGAELAPADSLGHRADPPP